MLKLFALSSSSLVLAITATQLACDEVDRAYDCAQICDKYKTCADANYDDGSCAERCRDSAAESEAVEDKADECQACIDDRSCVGAVFGCTAACVGIVP